MKHFDKHEQETKKIRKKIVTQSFLIISFLPHVLLLIIAAAIGIFQLPIPTSFLSGSAYYGVDAFWHVLGWGAMALCIIPILPVCTIYQIVYIIVKITEKRK